VQWHEVDNFQKWEQFSQRTVSKTLKTQAWLAQVNLKKNSNTVVGTIKLYHDKFCHVALLLSSTLLEHLTSPYLNTNEQKAGILIKRFRKHSKNFSVVLYSTLFRFYNFFHSDQMLHLKRSVMIFTSCSNLHLPSQTQQKHYHFLNDLLSYR